MHTIEVNPCAKIVCMKRMHISLSESEFQAISRVAAEEGKDRSRLLLEAFQLYLQRKRAEEGLAVMDRIAREMPPGPPVVELIRRDRESH